MLVNVVGPSVYIVQPGLVQGLVEHLGYSPAEAGYVTSVEMWGIAVGALLLMFFVSRLDWRVGLRLAATLMVCGNLASTIAQEPALFILARGVAGLGAGVMISLGFTLLGLTRNPDRNFGYMVMWVLLYGAITMALIPMIFAALGVRGLIALFTLIAFIPMLFAHYLPRSAKERSEAPADTVSVAPLFHYLIIAGIFVFFLGVSAIWAYLFLIGTNAGGTEQAVANGIMASQFAAAAGALTAATLTNRFGRIKPLTAALVGCFLPLFLLFDVTTMWSYLIGICLFNYSYNMAHPYLYAALASIDESGRKVTYAIAGQLLGMAFGPLIAASVVSSGSFSGVVIIAIAAFIVSLLLILPSLFNHGSIVRQTRLTPEVFESTRASK